MAHCVLLVPYASLMHCTARSDVSSVSAVVDIFNATSGTWSTAVLSVARSLLAATSLPNHGIAIFAGGDDGACVFIFVFGW
jgi:hypothetical protein